MESAHQPPNMHNAAAAHRPCPTPAPPAYPLAAVIPLVLLLLVRLLVLTAALRVDILLQWQWRNADGGVDTITRTVQSSVFSHGGRAVQA